jgi:hypothetical protein
MLGSALLWWYSVIGFQLEVEEVFRNGLRNDDGLGRDLVDSRCWMIKDQVWHVWSR